MQRPKHHSESYNYQVLVLSAQHAAAVSMLLTALSMLL